MPIAYRTIQMWLGHSEQTRRRASVYALFRLRALHPIYHVGLGKEVVHPLKTLHVQHLRRVLGILSGLSSLFFSTAYYHSLVSSTNPNQSQVTYFHLFSCLPVVCTATIMSPSITNGPFLPSGATNTSRKGYNICELLALLGMQNKDEQVDFKRILRDFIIRTPGSKDGLDRDELASLTEEEIRDRATFFLDNIKISPFNQTAGKTFWPSHSFNPSSEPGPRPKKWTYANNRNGIIDFVTQIMITQQEYKREK
jgi:hypothetical protein